MATHQLCFDKSNGSPMGSMVDIRRKATERFHMGFALSVVTIRFKSVVFHHRDLHTRRQMVSPIVVLTPRIAGSSGI